MSTGATDTSTDDTSTEVTPSAPVDTTPPKTEDARPIPPTIRRPEDQVDYQKQLEESNKRYRSFEEEQQHQIERFHELNQKYEEQSRPLLQSVMDAQMHLEDQPAQTQVDPAIQRQIQAYQQKQPGGLNTILQMLMLGAGIAFTAFGWRRGWGARSGIMQGWGNAFKAYAANNKELASQQADNAYRIQELTWKENQERHQQLMDIYRNRRLNLDEKKQVFNETEKLYGMDLNRIKTESNMTSQQMKNLQSQIKAQHDMLKLQIATHSKVSELFGTAAGKEYRTYMMTTYGVDPGRSHEDLVKSQDILPYGDWLKYEATRSKTDVTGKTTEVPKGQTPGPKQSFDEAVKKFKQKYYSPGGQ